MIRRKILSVILTATLFLMMLFPNGITVYGASDIDNNIFDLSEGDIIISQATTEGVLHIKQDKNEKYILKEQPIIITGTTTEHTIKVDAATANITLDTVSINVSQRNLECAFQLVNHANVTLTLKENTQNTISSGFMRAGIEVSAGQSLTIQGGGELFAKGGGQAAGIGGASQQDGGSITLLSGKVTATGYDGGAGIGGGFQGNGGNITIKGGEVIAKNGGFRGGPGIGGGHRGSGGEITIEDGKVTAVGALYGAGIGGGCQANGGIITIKGGEVVATGGDFGAGIGSGKAFDDAPPNMETNRMNAVASVGQITIEGGRVKATGGRGGAGIGTGSLQDIRGYNDTGSNKIIISGGEVEALGVSIAGLYMKGIQDGGAGIGRGATHNTSTEYVFYAREEETGIETDTVRHKGVEVTITGAAQVKSASTGVKPAIEPGGANSNIGTAVLLADISLQSANAEVSLNNTNSSEMIHFKPAYGYSSIAFTVTPHNTYALQVAGKTEKTIFNVGGTEISKFDFTSDSLKVAADKVALTENQIKGGNPSLSHITGALANLLPISGSINGSSITWKSSKPTVVSDDGQKVVRPAYNAGTVAVTLTATIMNGAVTDTKEFTLRVLEAEPVAPVITTLILASGRVGASYNEILTATGDSPITWSLESGTLPVGLTLDSKTGVISGTPTTLGTSTFTVRANNGVNSESTKELSITIDAVHIVKYTVTFDSNGGNSVAPITEITSGSSTTLPMPTRSGYSFEGWFEDDVRYSNTTPITKNVILTAKWEQNISGSGSSSGGGTSSLSLNAEQVISTLSKDDKETIINLFKEYMPYTGLRANLTLEQLKALTHNKFTDKQLQEILDNPELLQKLGIDQSMMSNQVLLKPIQNPSFIDVNPVHWAYGSISEAASLGLVAGMPDGSFVPNNALQVEDTFVFLDRVLLLNNITESKLPRSIVEKYMNNRNHWAFSSMASIASKLSESTLKTVSEMGNQSLSRELLAQILYEITGGKLELKREEISFIDLEDSPYEEAINYCTRVGLLNGMDSTHMAPNKVLTRAELMSVLTRLNEKLK